MRRGGSPPVRVATPVTAGASIDGGAMDFREFANMCLVSQMEVNFESSSGASMKFGAFMPASLNWLPFGKGGKLSSFMEGAIATGNEFSTYSY